jgi:putative MATE family efflux protein
VLLGSVGVLFAPQLLALMGADAEVRRIGTGYTRVLLGGEASVILLFLGNAAFRAAGNAAVAMRVLLVANALNIVLDPCFIFGLGPFPRLGVTGAAVATTIGRGIGALLAVLTLFSGRERLRLSLASLRPRPAIMATVLRLAGPAAFQYLAGSASWAVMARLLADFGSQAVAGYTIAIRLVIFAILPAFGLANAAATLVGQALGARDTARAERAAWTAARYNAWLLGITGVLFLLFASPVVARFTDDVVVRDEAVRCLRILALGFPIYGLGMVLTQAFNGAGDTWTPTWLNVLCFWVLELPLAWLLMGPAGLGPTGAYIAITVAFCTLALAGWVVFRRGAWQQRTV